MRQMIIVVLAVVLAGFFSFYNPANIYAGDPAENIEQSPEAQFNLGHKYAKGDGVPQNYAEAVKWYRKAAEQGYAVAQFNLGFMYDQGDGVPQDYAEAAKWYRKAADQGYADAQCILGLLYATGEGVPQNYAEAANWSRKAAEQGYADAQFSLGLMYANGQGVPQDYAEAVKWYRKAAEQGDATAQANLGLMYANGQGVPQNYTEAVKWYRKSAKQGNADAQVSLGEMYANGQGVPQDYAEAVNWFRKAAEQGNAGGQANLGLKYYKGEGVPHDYAEAAKWYRKAAEQGNARAQYNLGFMYKNGQGVPQDYAEAVKWSRKAAEQGNAYAQFYLGFMYLEGKGVPQDYAEAVKWYRKAAEQGDAGGQFSLGFGYAKGIGVPKDYAEAVKWYRKAVEQGNAYAQFNLGFMYANGQGVPQDYAEAAKWYRKAAEQGNADAQYNLGNIYDEGQGVPQNDVNAYAWLSLAAAQGNEGAAKARDSISNRLSPKQLSQGQALASQLQTKIDKSTAQAEKAAPANPPTVTANEPQQPPNIPSWAKPLDQPTVAANLPPQQPGTVVESDEQASDPAESAPAVTPELLYSLLLLISVAILLFFLWRIYKTIAAKFHPQDESKSHRQQAAPPHESIQTHYDRLKVARDAPPEVIAAAYKSLSKIHHPDRNPGNAEAVTIMALINASYDILSAPDKRRQYDLWLQQQESEAHTTKQAEAAQPSSAKPAQKIKKGGSLFFAHLLRYWALYGMAAFVAVMWATDKPSPPPPGPKPYLASPPPAPPPVKPAWVRPATAPNGQPWPTSAAYIKGYKLLHTDGLTTVTIDNSQNDADVFIKLVSLDNPQAYPVRQFFIPAQGKFTMKKVTAGSYDIRYRDLGSGELARSESFRLKEEQTNDGTRYSNFTMTLYKVRDGNMNTFGLSEEEF